MNKDKIFDELLVLKCKSGDGKAFRLLINRWHKKLVYFAAKFTHDHEAARDVVQESWISIHKSINKLQTPSKFSTWAYRITYNKAIDYLRKQQIQLPLDEQHEISIPDTADDNTDIIGTISTLIKKMPVQHQSILTLFYTQQQSVKQIASILNLPEGTVKSRLYYAREFLKRKYYENM